MQHTLLVLRHGKSIHSSEYPTDFARPLSPRGVKSAKRIGRLLLDLELKPELIISSPAARAIGTANLVLEAIGGAELIEERSVYDAYLDDLVDLVRELPDDCRTVLLVGHNPDLEELVEDLTGDSVILKTCSLAVISLKDEHWQMLQEGGCVLESLFHARELGE